MDASRLLSKLLIYEDFNMVDLINLTALAAPSILLIPTNTAGVVIGSPSLQNVLHSKHLSSGALTADTYRNMVALSVSGWLRFCAVYRADATSRTVGLKIVIDGVTALERSDSAAGTNGLGWVAVGSFDSGSGESKEWIHFNTSLSLQIKSSITETDKIVLLYSTAETP